MRLQQELVERLALKRRAKLGDMSDSAYQELLRSVRENPVVFVDDDEDKAFALVVQAVERYQHSVVGAEYLDEEAWHIAHLQRMNRLSSDCDAALALDNFCFDASICSIIAGGLDPFEQLDELVSLHERMCELGKGLPTQEGDAWEDVFARGYLRLLFTFGLSCLEAGCYRKARDVSEELLALAPSDVLGARHTCMLALARLEDEPAFDALDARLSRQGDAWSHLARTLLLYKLGRMSAARRALLGYTQLVEGGAYALLRPMLVDTYVLERPECEPCSYTEAMLAVCEADPIICDIPDFGYWAESIPEVAQSGRLFAQRAGFEW